MALTFDHFKDPKSILLNQFNASCKELALLACIVALSKVGNNIL